MTGWLEAWGQPLEPVTSDAVETAMSEPSEGSADMHMTDATDDMEMCGATDGMDMMDTSGTEATDRIGMDGMMSECDMAALGEVTGAEFDDVWLNSMIEHHEGAIAMAETEQSAGLNPDAIRLAGQIIEAQQAEIDEMNDLLADGSDIHHTATTELPATTG